MSQQLQNLGSCETNCSKGCACYLDFVEKFILVPLTEVQAAFLLHVNICVSNSLPSHECLSTKNTSKPLDVILLFVRVAGQPGVLL